MSSRSYIAASVGFFLTFAVHHTRSGGEAPAPHTAEKEEPSYCAPHREIIVDGDVADWQGVKTETVAEADHLWFGQGMTRDKWKGDRDLSYTWRAAWFGNRLFFLLEVRDDKLPEPTHKYSYLNDCVEIFLDYRNLKGPRIVGSGKERKLKGYEIHFVPFSPPKVYLSEALGSYFLDKPQNNVFVRDWSGEIAGKRTGAGYMIEIGFSIPGFQLHPLHVMGIDVSVCDDDGMGRESLLLWTGSRGVKFWRQMDKYGKLILSKSE